MSSLLAVLPTMASRNSRTNSVLVVSVSSKVSPKESWILIISSTGKRVNHAEAKELLAGFVGAWADKLVETKGRDEIDKAKEKHRTNELAQKRAVEMYDEHYAGADQYDTKNVDPPSFENNI